MDSRMTFASMGKAINVVLPGTLHCIMHWEGIFARHSSLLQTHLTEIPMVAQCAYTSDGSTMVGTTKHRGRSKFRLPHIKKRALEELASVRFRSSARIFRWKQLEIFFTISFKIQTLRLAFLYSSK
jgi:hypothetical protein